MESKGWKSFDFGPAKSVLKSSECSENRSENLSVIKPVKYTSTKKVKHISPETMNTFDFHGKLKPNCVKDLAVHPKKIQEVENWLKFNIVNANKGKERYLLLSGPTGSGKTATVSILCKTMGISITEWVNPVDQEYEYKGQSQINQFIEFLVESKWSSLFESENYKVTIVKDFPNAVIHKPELFFEILEECSYKLENPIIFICTEASSYNINLVRTLFPESILTKYSITHISFNGCAASLMKNALKRAQSLIEDNPTLFKQPSSCTIDAILASGMGDIRNTMNQFYVASLLGSKEIPTVSTELVPSGTKRKKNSKETKLKSMIRDDKLGLFHGLGRVLFPKRKNVESSWRLFYNVEELVEEFFTLPSMFTSFLFENYLKYFGDIGDASKAAEYLSFSARLLENWERHESLIFGLWISVLGVMIHNEHKISRWNQIKAPKKMSTDNSRSFEDLSVKSTDCFYYNLIKKSNKFHKFQLD